MRLKKNKNLRKTSKLFFSLFLLVFFLEIMIRWTSPNNSYLLFRPNTTYKFTMDTANIKGWDDSSVVKINKDGYRGNIYDPTANYHILVLGASTTECFLLDETKTWTSLLEKKVSKSLNKKIWIGNLGKSGINSQHHIEQLKTLVPIFSKIDLIIVLMGVNDMLRELKYSSDFKPLKPEKIENTLYSYYSNTSQASFPNNLKFIELIKKRNVFYFPKKTINMHLDGNLLNKSTAKRFFSKNKINRTPEINKGLNLYKRNIVEIIDLCKKKNTELLLLTQPYIWKNQMTDKEKKLLWMGSKENNSTKDTLFYHTKVLKERMDIYNKTTKDIAANNSIKIFDLDAVIEKNISNFYDDIHFNKSGALSISKHLVAPVKSILENK